jgi:hypothetical protein
MPLQFFFYSFINCFYFFQGKENLKFKILVFYIVVYKLYIVHKKNLLVFTHTIIEIKLQNEKERKKDRSSSIYYCM